MNRLIIPTRSQTHNLKRILRPVASTGPAAIVMQMVPRRYMSDNLLGYNPMSNTSSTSKNIKSKPTPGAPPPPGIDIPTGASTEKPVMGVDSNTEGGGVWAQTNAKRDKLGELRMELNFDAGQRSLDDMANQEQQLDLWLVDGIRAVVSFVDGVELRGDCVQQLRGTGQDAQDTVTQVHIPCLDDFYTLLREFQEATVQLQQQQQQQQSSSLEEEGKCHIGKEEYEKHLNNLMTHVEQIRLHHPAAPPIHLEKGAAPTTPATATTSTSTNNSTSQSSLLHIRDIMEYTPPNEPAKTTSKTPAAIAAAKAAAKSTEVIPTSLEKDLSQPLLQPLTECSEYFRILLLQSCLLQLSTQWDDLTKISDADQDRAATKGETISPLEHINVIALHGVLEAFGTKGCVERTESLWKLMDRDGDGLLDQVEMDQVVHMSLKPVEVAVRAFVEDCIEVWPLRGGFPLLGDDSSSSFAGAAGEEVSLDVNANANVEKGRYKKWKEERTEKKAKKVLLKLLDGTIKRHFDVDVEIPHRLRCCYAWADKKHQDGNVQSVLVENTDSGASTSGDSSTSTDAATANASGGASAGFLTARKRYVELDPKIAYDEFRDVQKDNFPHLDRIAQELCIGFKEEVWILQGKGRQDAETRKEALAFLGVVSLIDMAIQLT